ncbi:MAG: energy-coupled thiamine transporter ThiT [Solibacillus sp.]
MQQKKLRMLVEIALFASIGVIFNMLTFDFMPQGGGVSLMMIPIFLIAIRWGFLAGFSTGMLIGFVDVATGATVYHWAQVLLDHCLASAVVGTIALVNKLIHGALRDGNKRTLILALTFGVLIASLCKYIVHVLSGVIFFYMYANGQNIWLYSIIYNAIPMIPMTIVSVLVIILLLTSVPKFAQPKFIELR